jgi:hypothetical protein
MKGKIAWVVKDKHTEYCELRDDYPDHLQWNEEYEITKIVYFEVEE